MFNLTKKKVIIILITVVVYTIIGALVLSSGSTTRDATPEELEYYHAFLTDWKAIPGVDTSLSEMEIILPMCTLKETQSTDTTNPTGTTGTTNPTGTTGTTNATVPEGTADTTGKYTSELVPKYLYRYESNLAIDVQDNILVVAYMDKEDHYVLTTYDETGIRQMIVHNQNDDVAFFEEDGVAQVMTNFSYSISVRT
jgi:hypothetical protein